MARSISLHLAVVLALFAGCALASTAAEARNRKLLQDVTGLLGPQDTIPGQGQTKTEESLEIMGYKIGNRKLQQGIVGQIICDALGNCDDGRGNRYYDQNRDDRRRGDGNRGYDNNRDYDNNRGYDNRGGYDGNNWGK